MLSAFLIALREGVEASLVVGIILVYLARTSRTHLVRFVWYGVAAAAALSLAVAVALDRWRIVTKEFRENLKWAVVVPGDSAMSPAIAALLDEMLGRGITVLNSLFGSW